MQLARVRAELHATMTRPADPAFCECGAQQRHKIARHITAVAEVTEHVSGDIVQHFVGSSIGQIEGKHEFVTGHRGRFYSER